MKRLLIAILITASLTARSQGQMPFKQIKDGEYIFSKTLVVKGREEAKYTLLVRMIVPVVAWDRLKKELYDEEYMKFIADCLMICAHLNLGGGPGFQPVNSMNISYQAETGKFLTKMACKIDDIHGKPVEVYVISQFQPKNK